MNRSGGGLGDKIKVYKKKLSTTMCHGFGETLLFDDLLSNFYEEFKI